jgi:hypothetical protein
MSYVMSAPTYSISDIYGGLYVDLEPGSNGNSSGDPTYTIGDDQGMEQWGFTQWDSDLSDGFDTGPVNVDFTAWAAGQESATIGSNTPLSYDGDAIGTIGSVVLRAGVLVSGEAKFSNVTVEFYHDDSLLETDSISAGPDANTLDGSATQQEQLLTISPTATNANKVVVCATAQLRSPTDTAPGPTDMFCDIFVQS